jgi:hypothetical protein
MFGEYCNEGILQVGFGDVDWSHLAHNMNIWAAYGPENLSSALEIARLPGGTKLQTVIRICIHSNQIA